MFTDEDEQREVAGLFNATIHQVEGKNDKGNRTQGDCYPYQAKQYRLPLKASGTYRYGGHDEDY